MAEVGYVRRRPGRHSLPPEVRKERIKACQAAWRANNKEHIKLYERYRSTLPAIAARERLPKLTDFLKKKDTGESSPRVQETKDPANIFPRPLQITLTQHEEATTN